MFLISASTEKGERMLREGKTSSRSTLFSLISDPLLPDLTRKIEDFVLLDE